MSSQGKEEKLVSGCLKGLESYQKELYYTYLNKMTAICFRYTKNRDEASDVLHEGYIKVFKNLGQFSFQGSLEGWIKRIMVNTAINHYKKNIRQNDIARLQNEDGEEISKYLVSDEQILENISVKDLMNLIKELSPAYQMVFNLYAIEGYSHKQIAEELKINESTSRSNYLKARKKMQEKVLELNKVQEEYGG
ncbi:MAG: sigma-70 family RNA polymerase sigma factor [Flavobacteriales bacterium]|nr:sigma-70 family RNA polymerase sigma factor [Flavobacteriales bacterium]